MRQKLAGGHVYLVFHREVFGEREGHLGLAVRHLDLVIAVHIGFSVTRTAIIFIGDLHARQRLLRGRIGHMPLDVLRPKGRRHAQQAH